MHHVVSGSLRYSLRGLRPGQTYSFGGSRGADNIGFGNPVKLRGRHLLDHEALTCLLVLLFVDEPKLNTSRLHRVLRNLCYHAPTRTWVIRSMLSILGRTGDRVEIEDKPKTPERGKLKKSQQPMQTDGLGTSSSKVEARNHGSWLSISLEAALGCRANVFQIQRTGGGKKHCSGGNAQVTVHPQAAPVVCRHVLDALISLARMFRCHFLPAKAKEVHKSCDNKDMDSKSKTSVSASGATPKVKSDKTDKDSETRDTDFWELLVKLDSQCNSRKGKGIQRVHSSVGSEQESAYKDYESSPLGQLMLMLSHPVIKRSQLLTDRLLRLLGLISQSLVEPDQSGASTSRASISRSATAMEALPQVVCRRVNPSAPPTVQQVRISLHSYRNAAILSR